VYNWRSARKWVPHIPPFKLT